MRPLTKAPSAIGNTVVALCSQSPACIPWRGCCRSPSKATAAPTIRPTQWIFVPRLDNYRELLTDPAFLASLTNSVQLSVIATALCVIFGAMSAYALSRYDIKGAATLTFGFAITRLVPSFAIVIPTFYIYRELNLLDTMVGFDPGAGGLSGAAVHTDHVSHLQRDPALAGRGREDRRREHLRIFVLIILPIARPGLAACAVVTFILVWNEFLFILVLAGNKLVTIPMTIAAFQTDKQILWGAIAASSVISLIPILAAHRLRPPTPVVGPRARRGSRITLLNRQEVE